MSLTTAKLVACCLLTIGLSALGSDCLLVSAAGSPTGSQSSETQREFRIVDGHFELTGRLFYLLESGNAHKRKGTP